MVNQFYFVERLHTDQQQLYLNKVGSSSYVDPLVFTIKTTSDISNLNW